MAALEAVQAALDEKLQLNMDNVNTQLKQTQAMQQALTDAQVRVKSMQVIDISQLFLDLHTTQLKLHALLHRL